MVKNDIRLPAWATRNMLRHVPGEKAKEEEEHVGRVMEQAEVSWGHGKLR